MMISMQGAIQIIRDTTFLALIILKHCFKKQKSTCDTSSTPLPPSVTYYLNDPQSSNEPYGNAIKVFVIAVSL